MKKLGLGAALGVAGAWFLDPQSGARRRHLTRDRGSAFLRRALRKTRRAARGVAAEAYGVKQRTTHLHEREKPQPNDATLTAKIESEVLRAADMPKGQVNVNAEYGIVILRGQVERQELIDELEARVRKVHGVRGVENLLHLPGAQPRMHQAHDAAR